MENYYQYLHFSPKTDLLPGAGHGVRPGAAEVHGGHGAAQHQQRVVEEGGGEVEPAEVTVTSHIQGGGGTTIGGRKHDHYLEPGITESAPALVPAAAACRQLRGVRVSGPQQREEVEAPEVSARVGSLQQRQVHLQTGHQELGALRQQPALPAAGHGGDK